MGEEGVDGRVELWEGGCFRGPLHPRPRSVPAGPPIPPYHPSFLSRSAPASNLAVIGIAKQTVLVFVGSMNHIEIYKGNNVDAELEIHSPCQALPPPVRPTTLWHLLSTAPAWRLPRCSKARAWSLTCPCYCKVYWVLCFLALLPDWTKCT